jgi:hypothetical protein
MRNIATVLWFVILIIVSIVLADKIESENLIWLDLDIYKITLGVAFGVLFTAPMSWFFYSYFSQVKAFQSPLQNSYVVTFLPFLGKYVPGKVWAVFGFVYYAKLFAGIRSVDSGIFQIHVQVTNLLASVGISAIGILLFKDKFEGALFDKILLSLLILSGLLVALVVFLNTQCHRVHHNYKLSLVLPHSFIFCIIKILRGIALLVFLAGVLPVEGHVLEIMFVFIIAMQIGSLAFFAPAGLGVTEGVYLILLSGTLSPEQALQIAVISRIWQTATDFLLSISAYMLQMRLPIVEEK